MHPNRTRLLPRALSAELRRLPWRGLGAALYAAALLGWVSLAGWNFADPSFNNATDALPRNWLGYPGAVAADLLMQIFGLASIGALLPLAAFGWQILQGILPQRIKRRLLVWIASALILSGALSLAPAPEGWPLQHGLGGAAGDFVASGIAWITGASGNFAIKSLLSVLMAVAGFWLLLRACGLSWRDCAVLVQHEHKGFAVELGLQKPPAASTMEGVQRRFRRWTNGLSPETKKVMAMPKQPREFWMASGEPYAEARADAQPAPVAVSAGRSRALGAAAFTSAFLDWAKAKTGRHSNAAGGGRETADGDGPHAFSDETLDDDFRIEPFFGPRQAGAYDAAPPDDRPPNGFGGGESSGFRRLTGAASVVQAEGKRILARMTQAALAEAKRATPVAAFVEEADDDFDMPDIGSKLPPLDLLSAPPAAEVKLAADDPALMQRAAMLMEVLGDFGVKGRIAGIYPGPVITLFELEPARGTKSSRVVGLADDIARSMSAISARVAVVPGRDAIGIELPNEKREKVSLRGILESQAFQLSQFALPLALGKTIGGEPAVVDLARMPHLLIAGTTGSGKSVGINTMILSLIYRLPPSQCKFIMIDPKMLELSVYDGIPHLLAPVVTDPKKAVAALKWTVREMNDRYERMCKLGVRNVTSYNARAAAAQLRGQPLKRRIQTGFDPRSGEALFEEEILDGEPMPYIVVVIDEMADLMMVAGKEIEFAVQRLAQMARAAGIHLIMATQRPSVDVITGTIKANFPSRISFQVTSKIDSRTIIGEMGAEQLLGAGDMLYMSAGGRIMRAHGPFVSDEEVERIAGYLKAQGVPDYREDILEGAEDDGDETADAAESGKGGGDLYEQAVEIVLRDRKPTTSYLQRRLGIGYNRAASLIERMEEDGVIGSPSRTGRREILVDAAN